MRELLARVNAHLRRVAAFETSEEEIFDDGTARTSTGPASRSVCTASGST